MAQTSARRTATELALGQLLLGGAALAAVVLLGTQPSRAYFGNAPWCAIVSVGFDTSMEECVFADFESCRQHVIAGNRGDCTDNPRWAGYVPPPPKPRVRKRAHH